ncbi:MAG TPA: amino acid ABC transporter permease [Mycobacteriales bacterium]|nr:amino acid ABC transporter permease [Mycobacteriales bacterium]
MSSQGDAYVVSDKERQRREFRRARQRRSTMVATGSTIVVAVALWFGITHAPGWHDARATFFSGGSFRHDAPDIAKGLLIDLEILAIASPCVVVLALIIATMRTSVSPVLAPFRIGGALYVDLFRGCPMILLLILFGVGIPSLRLHGVTNSAEVWGTAAIVLSYSGFVTEDFRAGILSVHPSQRAAARSLGLNSAQTLRLVVLPQAIRNVVPVLLNEFVSLQRDVGLVGIVGAAVDAVQQATIDNESTFNFTPYVIAALLFMVLAIPSGRLADRYTIRAFQRQQAGGAV